MKCVICGQPRTEASFIPQAGKCKETAFTDLKTIGLLH